MKIHPILKIIFVVFCCAIMSKLFLMSAVSVRDSRIKAMHERSVNSGYENSPYKNWTIAELQEHLEMIQEIYEKKILEAINQKKGNE